MGEMSAVPRGVLPPIHLNSFPLLSPAKAAGPAESAPAHHTHYQASHDEANPSPNAHQAHDVPHRVRGPAEARALPEMQGLHAGRVWHVPLLQGHEEVWWTWSYEAVLRPPAVLSGEFVVQSHSPKTAAARQQFCVADRAEDWFLQEGLESFPLFGWRREEEEMEKLSRSALVSPLLSFVAQAASLGHVCALWGGGSE